MTYDDKSKAELIAELQQQQRLVADLQALKTEYDQIRNTLTDTLAQVERAKQEWETTADSLPQLVCLLDSNGHIIRANRTVERWNLASVHNIRGVDAGELFRPGSTTQENYLRNFLTQVWPKLQQGRTAELEIEDKLLNRHLLIQVRPFSVQTSHQSHVSGSFAVLIVNDVTERKQAEAERLHFAKQLRTTADISKQLNVPLDPSLLLNRVVTLLQTRFSLHSVHIYLLDISNETLSIEAYASRDNGDNIDTTTPTIMLHDEQSLIAQAARRHEVTTTANDGLSPTQVAIPLIARGKVLGVLNIQHDTPYNFDQTDLDTFSTMAGQIGSTLERVRQLPDNPDVTLPAFTTDSVNHPLLNDVNHQLRSSLGLIISYSEMMLMEINGRLSLPMREDMQAIHDLSQYIFDNLSQILDLSAVESGQLTLIPENISVRSIIDEIAINSAPLLTGKPVELIVEIEDNLPLVSVDRYRMGQVLHNLVSNAVRCTDAGYISLRAFSDGNWVSLQVTDTGPGLSSRMQQHIFDYPAKSVTGLGDNPAYHFGLGLALSKRLVEIHGGTLDLQSQPNEGTTITIRLPLNVP